MNETNVDQLKLIASRIRGRVIEMSHKARAAHLGSALSCVDILTALYWSALNIHPAEPDAPARDRFVFSKGHAAPALYAALAFRGFFNPVLLNDFATQGSSLEEHPGPGCAPGVEAAAGSLGHGLSMACGMALAGRIQGNSYRVMTLISDGETNEGSVWEAAMFAATHGLDNMVAIIDFNKWQATGRSCEVMAIEPLIDKWSSFGWQAIEVDGHDITALARSLAPGANDSGRPLAIIAHTVKGKGVSFMEDDNNWHYRIPTADEVVRAKKELHLP